MTRQEARERAELMLAYADGATVELGGSGSDGVWVEIEHPAFDSTGRYRVKPDPPPRRLLRREDIELGKTVFNIQATGTTALATAVARDGVFLGRNFYTWQELFSECINPDGSPCTMPA